VPTRDPLPDPSTIEDTRLDELRRRLRELGDEG